MLSYLSEWNVDGITATHLNLNVCLVFSHRHAPAFNSNDTIECSSSIVQRGAHHWSYNWVHTSYLLHEDPKSYVTDDCLHSKLPQPMLGGVVSLTTSHSSDQRGLLMNGFRLRWLPWLVDTGLSNRCPVMSALFVELPACLSLLCLYLDVPGSYFCEKKSKRSSGESPHLASFFFP